MKTKIKFETTLVTPEIAEQYLDGRSRNRTIAKGTVDRLRKEFSNHGYRLTHQAIALDVDGKVIDGQHRLSAIVESGVPQWMVVARYADVDTAREAMLVIDRHKTRSIGDSLEITGDVENKGADRVASAILLLIAVHSCRPTSVPSDLIRETVLNYAEDYDAVRSIIPLKIGAVPLAPLMWMHKAWPDYITEITSNIINGTGLCTTAARLRDMVYEPLRASGSGADARVRKFLRIARGVEMLMDGEKDHSSWPCPERAKFVSRMTSKIKIAEAEAALR